MKLYNSETRLIEEFIPIHKNKVSLYTCGPTVYHFAHIGNLRSYIMEDVLEKSLKYLGYDVERVMNITDVGHLSSDGDTGEDKMLLGAKRENKTVMEIAAEYTEAFKTDCEKLNLKWPEKVIPATSCIDEYIKMITDLLDKGYGYISNGNVYFDTSKLNNYYRFGKQNANNMVVGAREDVTEDEGKRNQNDFVLWFTKSKFENQALRWNSPWGEGYPGWHIECSGISYKYLGENLDIHCGGVDNKFPHHTNEIAQTESYVGHKWCNYWFHVEHLNTKTGKMSKSGGNFITLSELRELGYDPLVFKFFCLQSHYRKQLVFSEESLNMAKSAYNKLLKRIESIQEDNSVVDYQSIDTYKNAFSSALENDLNTSYAITILLNVLKDNDLNNNTKLSLVRDFDLVLGLDLGKAISKINSDAAVEQIDDNLKLYIKSMIEKRNEAKRNKNFEEADKIRNELMKEGVLLIDTKEGTHFSVKKNEDEPSLTC